MADQQYSIRKPITVDISESATDSTVLDIEGMTLVGLEIPAEFNGTSITLKGSALTSATASQLAVYDSEGNQMTITTAASRYVAINPASLHGLRYLQLICGTNQADTDTVFYAVLRDLRG
jgi:hypothetical protein